MCGEDSKISKRHIVLVMLSDHNSQKCKNYVGQENVG